MARIDRNFVTKAAASLETTNAMHAEAGIWTEPSQVESGPHAHLMPESGALELATLTDHGFSQPADALFESFQPVAEEAKLRTKELSAANEQLRAAKAELAARLEELEVQITRQAAQQTEDARNMEAILHALTCSQRLLRCDPQLLRYLTLSCGKPVCHAIALDVPVAGAVGERIGIIADKRAEIHWDGPLPVVMADESLLQEVLGHLLDNALMYVAPGVMPRVRLWTEKNQSTVRLHIEDNGVGIQNQDRERIFRLFERATGNQPGAGIGLAIVRRAMNQMNGAVGVESKPNGGSRFWIELPVST